MFIEGFLRYECILLELFDTPVPGLIGITEEEEEIILYCNKTIYYWEGTK